MLNYWSSSSLLVSTSTIVLDDKNRENHWKSFLFIFKCTSQGEKYRQFFDKNDLKLAWLDHCKFELGCCKTFPIRYERKVVWLNISNFVNTEVQNFINASPTWSQIIYPWKKKKKQTKIDKQKGVCRIEIFWLF